MKHYIPLSSLIIIASISLTSCFSKNERTVVTSDVKIGDEQENATSELSSNIKNINQQSKAFKEGKVHYFPDIVMRHSNPTEAFNAITNGYDYSNVIIDFYADWCGPCKTLGSVLNDIAPKNPSVLIVKINIEQFPNIAQQYNVKSLPTLLFFKNGSLSKTMKGFNKKELLESIKNIF